ncbi:MAG: hypothetical protein CMJ78_22325 [Planctomycetaceae bacterium]|nr:hypothetical protein [Planctomycetaceae bacterium]
MNDAGQVRDPGLQALVTELASNMNGLAVISTRARVRDISGWEGTSVVSHELDHLSVEAGSVLLEEIGVQGTAEELAEAVQEVDGHALSVTLVGKYVVFAANGHVQDRFEIGLPRVDLVMGDNECEELAITPDVGEIGRELAPDAVRRRKNSEHTSQTFASIMQRYEVWLHGLEDREGDVEA